MRSFSIFVFPPRPLRWQYHFLNSPSKYFFRTPVVIFASGRMAFHPGGCADVNGNCYQQIALKGGNRAWAPRPEQKMASSLTRVAHLIKPHFFFFRADFVLLETVKHITPGGWNSGVGCSLILPCMYGCTACRCLCMCVVSESPLVWLLVNFNIPNLCSKLF